MSIVVAIDAKTGKKIHISEYNEEDVRCLDNPEHKLIAKKGESRTWHYCHKAGIDCTYGSKKMSDFHCYWQRRIQPEYLEIKMKNHRADIFIDGLVIEVQHSSIDKETIKEREKFYDNMCWLFDAHDIDVIEQKKFKNLVCYKLIKGKKDFLKAKKDVYLDFNHRGLMKIIKKKGIFIWCQKISLKRIDKKLFKNKLVDGADKRLDRPFYDLSSKTTKEETLNFIKDINN